MDERRRRGRIRLARRRRRILVQLQICDVWAQGEILRLGREGVFIQSALCVRPGDDILLVFKIDERKLELSGCIVRRAQGSEPKGFFVALDAQNKVYAELYEEFVTG